MLTLLRTVSSPVYNMQVIGHRSSGVSSAVLSAGPLLNDPTVDKTPDPDSCQVFCQTVFECSHFSWADGDYSWTEYANGWGNMLNSTFLKVPLVAGYSVLSKLIWLMSTSSLDQNIAHYYSKKKSLVIAITAKWSVIWIIASNNVYKRVTISGFQSITRPIGLTIQYL